ncbi:MAG TPA: hypothetical protein DCP69_12500 [Candidatus Omnitrophica bacterium]|nr:hypothetical protein [Candidatus Omnitrophota bacterium]
MKRDEARELFNSTLSYSDVTVESAKRLRDIIDSKMVESGLMNGTYRCQKTISRVGDPGKFFTGIKCKSFYFTGREAVSFNRDGFVGFAGWSDETNVQPILAGFAEWVNETAAAKQQAA